MLWLLNHTTLTMLWLFNHNILFGHCSGCLSLTTSFSKCCGCLTTCTSFWRCCGYLSTSFWRCCGCLSTSFWRCCGSLSTSFWRCCGYLTTSFCLCVWLLNYIIYFLESGQRAVSSRVDLGSVWMTVLHSPYANYIARKYWKLNKHQTHQHQYEWMNEWKFSA